MFIFTWGYKDISILMRHCLFKFNKKKNLFLKTLIPTHFLSRVVESPALWGSPKPCYENISSPAKWFIIVFF